MHTLAPAIFFAALALAVNVSPTNGVTVPKQHTKLFYDRIAPSENATVIHASPQAAVLAFVLKGKPCKMAGRIRHEGKCFLPSRIPRSVENDGQRID